LRSPNRKSGSNPSPPAPLVVSTYDTYGAGTAAYRLFRGLRALDSEATFLARSRVHPEPVVPIEQLHPSLVSVYARMEKRTTEAEIRMMQERKATGAIFWSDNRRDYPIARVINRFGADVVNLHWVGAGFVPIRALPRIQAPIVWTMHDWWAFTGGCHMPMDCTRYEAACGACPQLASTDPHDESHAILRAKQRAWRGLNLTIVTPSHALGDAVRSSALLGDQRVVVIPNGIDTAQFRPLPRAAARAELGLAPERRYILTGAWNIVSDRRKGFDLLQEALGHLDGMAGRDAVTLLVVGSSQPESPAPSPLPVQYLGQIASEAQMNAVYAASDVFVLPSRQENLPNMIMEALASGTPAVAFDIGGNGDMIAHEQNGYLAPAFDTAALAAGIRWALEHPAPEQAAGAARDTVLAQFDIAQVAARYQALYAEVVDHARRTA
jgi:glycosyltransferase involved in cell wall biosynthesis